MHATMKLYVCVQYVNSIKILMCACVCVCVVKPAVPTNFAYATKIWGCRSNINISVNVTLLFRVTRLLASSISIVFFA